MMIEDLFPNCRIVFQIHDCVDRGGKVLIPVFALGRAQELCILLETYWERMNLKVRRASTYNLFSLS